MPQPEQISPRATHSLGPFQQATLQQDEQPNQSGSPLMGRNVQATSSTGPRARLRIDPARGDRG